MGAERLTLPPETYAVCFFVLGYYFTYAVTASATGGTIFLHSYSFGVRGIFFVKQLQFQRRVFFFL